MSRKAAFYTGCCALSIAFTGSAALAQSAEEDAGGGNQVQEIVVTAQKVEQSINTVPMSITAATGEELETAGIESTEDLVKIVPGFNVTRSTAGNPFYTLRGVGFNDSLIGARPSVTVYIDEAPVPFSAMTRGSILDVERVEVLKGPQGTLFGANSTGGAINYVAAKPSRDLQYGGSVTYGRFDETDLSGYISGPMTDTLSGRLAVEYQGRGDYLKSITRDDTAGQENFVNARASLNWRPDDRLNVLVSAQRWVDKSDAPVSQAISLHPDSVGSPLLPVLVANYPYARRSARFADWDPDAELPRDVTYTQFIGRIDYEASDAITLTSITNYIDFEYNQLSEADGIPIDSADFFSEADVQTFSQELRATMDLGALRLIVGGNYQFDDVVETGREDLEFATPIIGLSLGFGNGIPVTGFQVLSDQEANSYAAFGNAEYALTDQLTLQGGIRYTKTTIDYRGCLADSGDGTAANAYTNLISFLIAPIDPIPPGGCTTLSSTTFQPGFANFRYDEDNVSWRAGIQFEPNDMTLLYANVSRGYKAGGFPFLNAFFDAALTPASQESVLAYETGFKAGLLDRAVQLNGAAFYYDYTDKQFVGTIVDPVLGPIGGLTNIPESRIYGAELQLTAVPVSGLTISGAGTWLKTDVLGNYTDTNDFGDLQNFHKTDLPDVPTWQLNGSIRYQWELTQKLDAFASISGRYKSGSYIALGELPDLRQEGYEVFDATLGVEGANGKWRAYLWGRNIFDKRYVTSYRTGIDTYLEYLGMPATYGVTLKFDM